MKISVHDLAHSKGMPAAATEAMLIMQDRIEAQEAEIERLKRDHTSLVAELNKTRALLKGYRRGFKKARLGETE